MTVTLVSSDLGRWTDAIFANVAQRIAHGRREMGTWKTSRKNKQRITQLFLTIVKMKDELKTNIACEEFYFAQPLKLYEIPQQKWKTH